jgi:transcriptional regulator NrdR family protein
MWGIMRRSVALLLGLVVVVGPTVACTSDGGSASARDDKTGTIVTVSRDKLDDGNLQLTTVNTPSVDTGGYKTFPGEATKVEVTGGKLKSGANAEVTISYPESATEEQVNNLVILRYEGSDWTALRPESVDKEKRTATVHTDQFSIWDIGWWDIEQATEKAKTKARNLFSSDGLLSGIGRAAGNPPVAEDCVHQALTLTIELDAFVPKTIECAKFVQDDTSRKTYTLQLSNRHTEPYLLRLPKGVSYESVTPEPGNPYSLLVDLLGRRMNDRSVVMGGGTMVTLKVDANQLDKDKPSVISGTLDLTRPILDLMSASLQVVMPAKPTDTVVKALANTDQAAQVGSCVYKHFDQIAKLKPTTTDALGDAIGAAFVDCAEVMKNFGMIMAAKMVEGWDRTQYATAAAKALLGSQIKAVVLVWQNSHVIPQMIGVVDELARNGFRTYTAKVTYEDPPFTRLGEVMPTDGGAFDNPSAPHASVQTFPTIGTQCVDKVAGNDWSNWLYSPSQFAGKWYTEGKIGSAAYVTYVKPQFRSTVKDYFVHLAGNGECDGKLRDQYGTYNQEWRSYDSNPGLKGFAVFHRVFVYVPNSDGFTPFFSATLYDPATGALIYLTTSDNAQNPLEEELPSEDALKSKLASQLDYFTNRTDVQLGTDFVPNK